VRRLNTKKVKMFAADSFVEHMSSFPAPTRKYIPEWYKRMPLFMGGGRKGGKLEWLGTKGNNATIKACIPVFDIMTSGYIMPLPMDVLVVRDASGAAKFSWREGGSSPLITEHDRDQIPDQMVPDEYERTPYKFSNYFHVETPAGYSLLFTHPLNRMDLPFHMISGLVDTDDYTAGINFPFFLKKGFEGLIQAGTPMVQIMPIKREPWELEIEKKFDDDKSFMTNAPLFSRMFRGYRDHFWTKKEYN
jgi:hypothetical protein